MEKNQENLVENEVEQIITEEEAQDTEKEEVYEEVVKVEGKFSHFFKVILSGILDQILAVGIALILFFIFDLIIGVVGYEIAMRDEMFLIIYIVSNVLYYPISQEILEGKTVGKKLILRTYTTEFY